MSKRERQYSWYTVRIAGCEVQRVWATSLGQACDRAKALERTVGMNPATVTGRR